MRLDLKLQFAIQDCTEANRLQGIVTASALPRAGAQHPHSLLYNNIILFKVFFYAVNNVLLLVGVFLKKSDIRNIKRGTDVFCALNVHAVVGVPFNKNNRKAGSTVFIEHILNGRAGRMCRGEKLCGRHVCSVFTV